MYFVRRKGEFIHRRVKKAFKNDPLARRGIIRTIGLDKENIGRKEEWRGRMGKRRIGIIKENRQFGKRNWWIEYRKVEVVVGIKGVDEESEGGRRQEGSISEVSGEVDVVESKGRMRVEGVDGIIRVERIEGITIKGVERRLISRNRRRIGNDVFTTQCWRIKTLIDFTKQYKWKTLESRNITLELDYDLEELVGRVEGLTLFSEGDIGGLVEEVFRFRR